MTRMLRRAALVPALLAAWAGPALAQADCVTPAERTLALSVGGVRWETAGGNHARGLETGVVGAARAGGLVFSAGLHHTVLEAGGARPITARLRAGRPLVSVAGIRICGALLAGGSRISQGGNTASSVAGGLALSAGRPLFLGRVTLSPYAGVRGLAARTGGEILEQEVATSGFSLGAEAGMGISVGRVAGALRGTADGFDPGLGATAHPALALRLQLGWRL